MTLEYLLILEKFFQEWYKGPIKKSLKYSIFSNIEQEQITQKGRGSGGPNVPPTPGLWYHAIREPGIILCIYKIEVSVKYFLFVVIK